LGLCVVVGLLLSLAVSDSHAAANSGNGNGNSPAKAAKNVPIGKGPILIGRPTVSASEKPGKGNPARPPRTNARPVSTTVKGLLAEFNTTREKYLTEQKALARQFKTASEDERAAIRGKLKEMLQVHKEQQRAFRQEIQNRIKSIKAELNPALRGVIDKSGDDRRRP
jgi:hypothetical protein